MIALESSGAVEVVGSPQASNEERAQRYGEAVEKVPIENRHWWRDYDSPYIRTAMTCAKCLYSEDMQAFDVEKVECTETTADFLKWLEERAALFKERNAVVSPERRHSHTVLWDPYKNEELPWALDCTEGNARRG
jgi:hypothetical protein